MEGVIGAGKGSSSAPYGGTRHVIGHRTRTVVEETRIVRTLIRDWLSVCGSGGCEGMCWQSVSKLQHPNDTSYPLEQGPMQCWTTLSSLYS